MSAAIEKPQPIEAATGVVCESANRKAGMHPRDVAGQALHERAREERLDRFSHSALLAPSSDLWKGIFRDRQVHRSSLPGEQPLPASRPSTIAVVVAIGAKASRARLICRFVSGTATALR